jgi:succinate dehydrogenase/fumarate reductase cytochrome b subunit
MPGWKTTVSKRGIRRALWEMQHLPEDQPASLRSRLLWWIGVLLVVLVVILRVRGVL